MPHKSVRMTETPEDVIALDVPCPYCGVLAGEICDWGPDMTHMQPNAHWARRTDWEVAHGRA